MTCVAKLLLLLMVYASLVASMAPPSPSPPPPKLAQKKYHVLVEGVIYCKKCKLPGYNKDVDASPLAGAVAKLKCNFSSSAKPYEVSATTDKKGYFFIQPSTKVTKKNVKYCKVFLVSSPEKRCNKPNNYNHGVVGARLRFQREFVENGADVYSLYTTGMLLFGPTTTNSCPS